MIEQVPHILRWKCLVTRVAVCYLYGTACQTIKLDDTLGSNSLSKKKYGVYSKPSALIREHQTNHLISSSARDRKERELSVSPRHLSAEFLKISLKARGVRFYMTKMVYLRTRDTSVWLVKPKEINIYAHSTTTTIIIFLLSGRIYSNMKTKCRHTFNALIPA